MPYFSLIHIEGVVNCSAGSYLSVHTEAPLLSLGICGNAEDVILAQRHGPLFFCMASLGRLRLPVYAEW